MSFWDYFKKDNRYCWDEYSEYMDEPKKKTFNNNNKPVGPITPEQRAAELKAKEDKEKWFACLSKAASEINKDSREKSEIVDEKELLLVGDLNYAKSYGSTEKYVLPKPIYKEKKNVIIFVLENTIKVNKYKNQVLGLIKKIVQDNKTALFLFLQVGNSKEFFDILDFETVQGENFIDHFLCIEKDKSDTVIFSEVLGHIDKFLSTLKANLRILEYKQKKYDIQSSSIIFIGTVDYDSNVDSKNEVLALMSSIRSDKNVKTIKYFCMEDKETINAAMLGFPVVGHIVSDFYK